MAGTERKTRVELDDDRVRGVDALAARAHPKPLAEALRRDPSIAKKAELVAMAGNFSHLGDETAPQAESNVRRKIPEAQVLAYIVKRRQSPIVSCDKRSASCS